MRASRALFRLLAAATLSLAGTVGLRAGELIERDPSESNIHFDTELFGRLPPTSAGAFSDYQVAVEVAVFQAEKALAQVIHQRLFSAQEEWLSSPPEAVLNGFTFFKQAKHQIVARETVTIAGFLTLHAVLRFDLAPTPLACDAFVMTRTIDRIEGFLCVDGPLDLATGRAALSALRITGVLR